MARQPKDNSKMNGNETLEALRQPPTQEEIKRRKKVFKRTLKLRQELPPMEMFTAEMVRQARRDEGIDG